MSVIAERDIAAGEELYVCYNYRLDQAPSWYTDLWKQHCQQQQNGSLGLWDRGCDGFIGIIRETGDLLVLCVNAVTEVINTFISQLVITITFLSTASSSSVSPSMVSVAPFIAPQWSQDELCVWWAEKMITPSLQDWSLADHETRFHTDATRQPLPHNSFFGTLIRLFVD